jgi:hypothetical protein
MVLLAACLAFAGAAEVHTAYGTRPRLKVPTSVASASARRDSPLELSAVGSSTLEDPPMGSQGAGSTSSGTTIR